MDQWLSGLKTDLELGWVGVHLAVKVYGPEAQANLSQLAVCLAIRSNFCKSHEGHFCSLWLVKPGPSQS